MITRAEIRRRIEAAIKWGRSGAWTWCKRGANFGLYRFGDVGERP